MEEFDVIVIGGGSGLTVSSAAAERGLKVAVIEKGPLGGTCLNRGCIPSKMILHSADVIQTIKNAGVFGVYPKGYSLDFGKIMRRANSLVAKEAREIEEGILETDGMTLFKKEAKFIGERMLEVGGKKIKGGKVVVAAGTRPGIPPIEGLGKVDFMTSDEALKLKKQPKTMIIVGGGYIAAELGHFYGSLETKIVFVQRNVRLLPDEDQEVGERFTRVFSKRYEVLLQTVAKSVKKQGRDILLTVEKKSGGGKKVLKAQSLLIATGRIPNTDILEVEKGGIEKTPEGFVKVNEYMETTAKNTWALGDIAGKFLFKHSANLEANYVFNNMFFEKKAVDYTAMPHAVFTDPQVAGVGMMEQELKEKKIPYLVGRYNYIRSGMGKAIEDRDGFVKILAEPGTKKILGCHIMGAHASSLIHEVIVAMKAGLTTDDVYRTVHIHPALSEVVQRAARNMRKV